MKVLEDFLVEFCRFIKIHSLYPPNHPAIHEMEKRSYGLLKAILSGMDNIFLQVKPEGFTFMNDFLLPGNKLLIELSKEFIIRRINGVSFKKGVLLEDLRALFKLIISDPKKIDSPSAFLKKLGIESIVIEELKIEHLKDLETSRKLIYGKDEDLKVDPVSYLSPVARKLLTEIIDIRKEVQEQDKKDFLDILLKMEVEKNPDDYHKLSLKLESLFHKVWSSDDKTTPLVALFLLRYHASSESDKHDDIKKIASESLRILAKTDVISYLIDRLCEKDEVIHDELNMLFPYLGSDSLNALTARLKKEERLQARKHLIKAISLFGKSAIPHLKSHLSDKNIYFVRNILTILGEIGAPESIDMIKDFINHKESLLKREAIKALGKIDDPNAVAILIELINSKNIEIVSTAISVLALKKEKEAEEKILTLMKRSPFLQRNIRVQLPAILYLGTIGSTKAIPYIKNILMRKPWINKELREQLRYEAAYALGKIGGNGAREVLELAISKGDDRIARICSDVLKSLDRKAKESEYAG